MVIFSNSVGDITAADIATGSIVWQLPTQSSNIINETFSFKISKLVSDGKSIYFSNNKRTPYKIKYFEINVIDPYRGESRFNGELIWSNSYSINLKNQKWQKSSTWSIKDGFKCREIKPKHTGVHFSSNIASNSLEVEDEFVFDFQYQNEIESDSIFLVLKIFNENSELKDETIKKIGESRSWKKESLSIKISKNVNIRNISINCKK